eukprot:m51a1_g11078 hypothetical protein (745) ;mRNA; r:567702-570697
MRRELAIAFALCVGAVSSYPLYAFSADIVISNDPSISGALKGTMVYQYGPNGASSYRKLSFSLPDKYNRNAADYTEIINYTEGTKFLKCPRTCTATMWKSPIDLFFPLAGESTGTFSRSSASSESLSSITFDASNTVSQAVYGNGKTFTFSNVVKSNTAFPSSTFDYSSWGCPARTCNVVMDLVLVLDDSGSIDADSWTALMQFTGAVSQSFKLSPDATNLGIVMFSDDSNAVLGLTSSQDSVTDAITTMYHHGGSTCIGCGIYAAADMLANRDPNRMAMNPKTVVITVTDGGNNAAPDGYGPRKYLKDGLWKLNSVAPTALSVVVSIHTEDWNPYVLSQIATNDSFIFPVQAYTNLMTILNKLITATCQDYPPSPCGASCSGFCACEECRCPNVCPTDDKCVSASCSTQGGVTGCHSTAIKIDDGNACTIDSCDPKIGISHAQTGKPVDCTANTTCSNYHCDVATGQCKPDANSCCGNDATHCSVGSKCNVTQCVMEGGNPQCKDSTAKCVGTVCSIASCDAGTGNCSFTPRSCDDGDFCTIDTCDASAGNTWETACKHTANPCDDSDPCTVDSCSNNQCVHKPLCDDGLRCTNDFCKATVDLKNATCKHVLLDCDDYNYTKPKGDNYTCYRFSCKEHTSDLCVLERFFSDSDNLCANCRNTTHKTTCIGGISAAAAGAIIGASAIAGIVVACVVGFLIFSAVSAFGTYKLVQMNRAGGNMGAHNNPMYKPSDAESVNPAYAS